MFTKNGNILKINGDWIKPSSPKYKGFVVRLIKDT